MRLRLTGAVDEAALHRVDQSRARNYLYDVDTTSAKNATAR
jgi:hypothetical protein